MERDMFGVADTETTGLRTRAWKVLNGIIKTRLSVYPVNLETDLVLYSTEPAGSSGRPLKCVLAQGNSHSLGILGQVNTKVFAAAGDVLAEIEISIEADDCITGIRGGGPAARDVVQIRSVQVLAWSQTSCLGESRRQRQTNKGDNELG